MFTLFPRLQHMKHIPVITFPPLAGTAGRMLYFSIESPGSVPGNAVTIYCHEEDVYSGGEMLVDGQAVGGDVAFIAYTRETFTLSDIWNDFYSRASQDRVFFTFYCTLLAILLVALAVTLLWPRRRHSGDAGRSSGGAVQGPKEVPPAGAESSSEADK